MTSTSPPSPRWPLACSSAPLLGCPRGWVTGDEVYGNDPGLRAEWEAQQIRYVLAIGCDRRVPTAAGPVRADALAGGLPRWA